MELSPRNLKRHLACLASLRKDVRHVFEKFLLEAQAAFPNFQIACICGTRTMAEQAALFASGRTRPGPRVTNARPGSSWHNKGLAVDLGIFDAAGVYLDDARPSQADKVYIEIGKIAGRHGIEHAMHWRTFPETPHFQLVPQGATLANTPNIS